MAEEIKRPKPTTSISEEFYADDRQYYTVIYPDISDDLTRRGKPPDGSVSDD